MQPIDLRIQDPERPNLPVITETTLPLLATVLAGFAVVAITQVFTRDEANLAGRSPNGWLITGLIVLSASVPLLLNSAIFAVWGQGYSYIHLTKDSKEILNIREHWATYIARLHKKWQIWHRAAVVTFYAGSLIFDVGIGILLWILIGSIAGLIFYTATIVPLMLVFTLLLIQERTINLQSKLDIHLVDIEALLKNGLTLKAVATRYNTTEAKLDHWIKKRGLQTTN